MSGSAPRELKTIMAVIDPTVGAQAQVALTRAAGLAAALDAEVIAFCCVFNPIRVDDADGLREVELERHSAWLGKIIEPHRAQGVKITEHLIWDPHWREAIGPCASEAGVDLIVKYTRHRDAVRRRLMKTSDWRLLRTAPCPVLLVKDEEAIKEGRVLAAVNLNASDTAHQRLNDGIIAMSQFLVKEFPNGELHAINAYAGADHFVHPPDLAKKVGIDRANAHSVDGPTDEAITECAKLMEADIVVIGTVGRSGVTGTVLGNTVELVLDRLDTDILTVVDTHD
ncbi:MAG: universal stress protein [Gammaproteobacteria bacterium]|nr:universal stress protein [Gammaproteobacteria bacterium]NNM01878.1 universal stress protein [Gammaproteobacteria bacterium]